MNQRTVWKLTLIGWLLFSASAAFYILSALHTNDSISLIASLLFLVACFVFLIPLWAQRPKRNL